MKALLKMPSVQIAICVAIYLGIGWRYGPFALVMTCPLLAAAIARPVINLVANLRGAARERVWLPVHGQYYVYKGVTLHILEDDDHWRWVPLADIRKIVGTTANESALAVAYPEKVLPLGKPARPHLREDAAIAHLSKENQASALKFRTWLEREVSFPARRLRERAGIRDETPQPATPGADPDRSAT